MAGDEVRSMAKAVTEYIGQCVAELSPVTALIWSCHFYTTDVRVHLVLEMRLEKGSWNSIKSHNVYERCMLTLHVDMIHPDRRQFLTQTKRPFQIALLFMPSLDSC